MKTNTPIHIIFILVLIIISSVYASNVASGTYNIDMYHLGLAGEKNENADYSYQFTNAYQQSFTEFASNSIYSLVTGWASEAEALVVTSIASISGKHKKEAACTYEWDCTSWFPYECPIDGVQERLCTNHGTCTDEKQKTEKRICDYAGPTEPLFDIFLTISKGFKEISPGENIEAQVKVKNIGKVELLDAFMTYSIVDENNNLMAETKDSRSVTNDLNYDIKMNLPSTTKEGIYRLYAQITYAKNKTAVAGESFSVVAKPIKEEPKVQPVLSSLTSKIILGFLALVLFLSFLHIKRKQDKKELLQLLAEYIQNNITKGHTLNTVKEHIINNGYKSEDVDEAIKLIDKLKS